MIVKSYLDPVWGAISGVLAFKLAQERAYPAERRIIPLISRGWNANFYRQQLEAEAERQAMAEVTASIHHVD